jgi:hypothetical protein
MPLRRRIIPRSEASPIRSAVTDAADAVREVLLGWVGRGELAEPLRRALALLRRDASLAIVLLDEPVRDVPAVVEASRAAAIQAALRLNACLASAYQERWAPPRTILAACHAVARLIEALQAPPARTDTTDVGPRWN